MNTMVAISPKRTRTHLRGIMTASDRADIIRRTFGAWKKPSTARKRSATNIDLQQQVELLRSAVIGIIGKDKEGEYKPAFVKATLASLTDEPLFEFSSASQFLARLKRVRAS